MIKEYVEKGIVTVKEKQYYINKGGESFCLGKLPAAENRLKAMVANGEVSPIDGTQSAPSPNAENSETPQTSTQTIDEALKSETPSQDLSFLSDIRDLVPNYQASIFAVYIQGVHYLLRDSRNAQERKTILSCPLEFYWLDKKDNVPNGSTISNKDWTVFDKKWAEPLGITWARDDTPNLPQVTVGQYVLCCCKRGQFEEKKVKQQLKGEFSRVEVVESRKEQARRAAALSKDDINAANQIYSASARESIDVSAQAESVATGNPIDEI
jgi:hypothetical protein